MSKRKYSLDQSVFDELNPFNAYWIGFLFADGYINKNRFQLVLAHKDRGHLDQYKNFLKTNRPIRYFLSTGDAEACEIRFRSWHMVKAVQPYDLHLNKRDRGRVSPLLLQQDIFPHFLRGYFDGDGCFTVDSRGYLTAEITATMAVLRDFKRMLVAEHIIRDKTKIVKNGRVMHRIRFTPKETILLGIYLYEGEPKYTLKRKRDLFFSHVERLIEATETVGSVNKLWHGLRLSTKSQSRK